MAKIERILLPQDQRVTLSNGMMNPAWYRFFVALQKQFPELISLAEQADAADATAASLDSRVGSLERNFLKDPLANVNSAAILATSPTFADDAAARLNDLTAAVNAANDRLRQSNIVRTE